MNASESIDRMAGFRLLDKKQDAAYVEWITHGTIAKVPNWSKQQVQEEIRATANRINQEVFRLTGCLSNREQQIFRMWLTGAHYREMEQRFGVPVRVIADVVTIVLIRKIKLSARSTVSIVLRRLKKFLP